MPPWFSVFFIGMGALRVGVAGGVVPLTLPAWFAIPVLSGILLPVFASPGSRWPELVGNTLFFGSIPALVIWWWYQRSQR